MRTWLKVFGAIAVVVISFLATDQLLDRSSPRCPAGQVQLARPFLKLGGFGYQSSGLPVSGDTPTSLSSKLMLCEDGFPIGPAHASHGDISKSGGGRFSHWSNTVIFSASDNTDPNSNGRSYSYLNPP